MTLKAQFLTDLERIKAKVARLLGHAEPDVHAVAHEVTGDIDSLKSAVESDTETLAHDTGHAAAPLEADAGHDAEEIAAEAGQDAKHAADPTIAADQPQMAEPAPATPAGQGTETETPGSNAR